MIKRHLFFNYFPVILTALMLLSVQSYSQTINFQPDEDLSRYGTEGSPEALYAAAAAFGGRSSSEQADSLTTFVTLVVQAEELADLIQDSAARGEALLQLLHDKVFKTYQETATTLEEALLYGRFNCVSSAVLYQLLGTKAGLIVSGIQTKDHAFCMVEVAPDHWIDVETTSPAGWDPGSRKEFHDEFNQTTGFIYVEAGNYMDRLPLNAIARISISMMPVQSRT